MDRLSPLDASFLHLEDDVNHMHLGSVAVFEGPAPSYADLTAAVTGRLPLVPRYRQRLRFVPYGLGRPVWVDDPHFNISYHVRHTALPAPGGIDQLRALTGRVMSQKLDLTKPLWEIWMAEGLEDGRWALVTKGHHALVDGIVGTELLGVLLDDSPRPTQPVPDTWRPTPPPSNVRLLAEALTDYAVSPYEQWRVARAAIRRPRRQLRRATTAVRGLGSLVGLGRPAPDSSLVGPIGPHRRYGTASVNLGQVRAIRRALGGDVNDVVLALVTHGFRDLLLAHGEPPERRLLRALVPLSVRRGGSGYDNQIAPVAVSLPVGEVDPVERLAAIGHEMQDAAADQAVAADTLTSLTGFAPPLLLSLATRAVSRTARGTGRHFGVGTVVTNAPGPRRPVYALGHALLEAYPYQPIAGPTRVGVAAFSYGGQICFGVTADYDAVADVDVLCRGIEAGAAALSGVAADRGVAS
jgi:diacylglycerol O-acyltransferase / wax synthase